MSVDEVIGRLNSFTSKEKLTPLRTTEELRQFFANSRK